jgi:hypothetical protein
MPAGEYLINFDHELWIALGTTASAPPTSTTGLTKVFNLTDASMSSTSNTQNVQDYDSDPTSERAAVLSIAKTMPVVLNLSPGDPGYQILMEVNEGGTSNLAVQYWRESAKVPGTAGAPEIRAGIATVTGQLHIILGAVVAIDPRDRLLVPPPFTSRNSTGAFSTGEDAQVVRVSPTMGPICRQHHTEVWTE